MRYCSFYASKLFPKNLIVIFRGQKWLIPRIVLLKVLKEFSSTRIAITCMFEHTWKHITQGCFVQSLVEIGIVVLEKIFKTNQCISYFPAITSPWKKVLSFIWTMLLDNSSKEAVIVPNFSKWFWRSKQTKMQILFTIIPTTKIHMRQWEYFD